MNYKTEVRVLMKILAIAGFIIIFILVTGYVFIRVRAPHLLEFSKGLKEYRISVQLDSLDGAKFIYGMKACENILPEKDSSGVYVSCLDGFIHYLVPDDQDRYRKEKSFKAGEAVLGMDFSENGDLYAAVCTSPGEDWFTTGGAIYFISRDLSSVLKLSENFPSMNGVCIDETGNLYFASSNFKLFWPDGNIYRMPADRNGALSSPELFIPKAGAANGLYFDSRQDKIFFSNTLGGVYSFSSSENNLRDVYLKLRFIEACDDLCTDISGNVWMTDPGQSAIKVFNPGTGRLVRFNVEGIGQTSSCRIRSENGNEMLYITELKATQSPMSSDFDGRGVLIVPAQSLLELLEPVLTKEKLQ